MGRAKKFDPDVAVERAVDAFRVRGYGETSPQELADRMGIGKGSLYHAFGSKHELFLKSLEHYADQSLAELKAVMEGPEPIRDRVRRLLESFVDADLRDPDRCGCLIVNSVAELHDREDPASRFLGRSLENSESVIRTALVAAQAAGEIDADRDPAALAGLVQAAMVGLRVLVKTTDDRARLALIVDATVQTL
ncbi:TetR/AcrR family transcriptional regulator [Actinoplanes sp. NPDC051346]|uniref:TetR/AcrR family transcriptional regulator n=1 Tax=Actinoplanes sp. NPDC051346 TaxID=3155048 RepID=UPI00342192A6